MLAYHNPYTEYVYEPNWELAGSLTHYHNSWGTGNKRLFLDSCKVPDRLTHVESCLMQEVYLQAGDEFKLAKINEYGVWKAGMGYRTIAYKLNGDETDSPGNDFAQGSEYDNIRVMNSGHFRIYLCDPDSVCRKIVYERLD